MGIGRGSWVFRLGSALFLCVLVSGCGFRSGLETGEFELVSFELDRSSYVQGQIGFAGATIRNLGPTTSAPPAMSLHLDRGDGEEGSFTFEITLLPEEIPPGATAVVKWEFASSETDEPGTGRAWVKLVDDSGQSESPLVPFELFRAASLQVTDLAFVDPPGFGAGPAPPDFACAGGRDAYVEATVQNVGATAANVTGADLLVLRDAGSTEGYFHLHPFESNPASLAAGSTQSFLFQVEAEAVAPPGLDYSLVFTAAVTDAVTGNVRPAPVQPEALDLALTVHTAALALELQESVNTMTVATPPVAVTVKALSAGTVTLQLESVSLSMFIGGETTGDYVIGDPSPAPPFELAPFTFELVNLVLRLDTSLSPVTGTTEVHGLASAFDSVCGSTLFVNSETNGSVGAWLVE